MAYVSNDKLWRSEFYNNVSAKDSVQEIAKDINLKQLKQGKRYFEHSNDDDVIDKAHLDTKLSKIEVHVKYLEKEYNIYCITIRMQDSQRMRS